MTVQRSERCAAHGAPCIGRLDGLDGLPVATLWADGCIAWLTDPNGLTTADAAIVATAAVVAEAVVDAAIAEVASIAREYQMAATDMEDGAYR